MHRLVRAIMAISLIAGDAAQAASLTDTFGGARGASHPVASDPARLQDLIERETETWRRISTSICRGCGAPPPPLEITRADPFPVRGQPEAAAPAPEPDTNAGRPALRPASFRSTGLRKPDGVHRAHLRAEPATTRLTARTRRYARTARLRVLRHRRRLALLRARRRMHALRVAEKRASAHRLRLAGLRTGFPRQEEGPSGGSHRPGPLRPGRPDALCADDRGLATARLRPVSACIGAR